MAVALAKGQLSYLILSCLEEKDMYGLELIDEIKKRSGVEIKMPSLYSNLNRMKELKFISSYLKESNKGPKCSYSSITEAGRNELAKLKETFKENEPTSTSDVNAKEEVLEETVSEKEELKDKFDDYGDFFADIPEEEPKKEVEEEKIIEKNQEVKEIAHQESLLLEETKVESPKNDAVFLPKNESNASSIDEYNRKIFDVSMDYNKYKKKKSFSENQIEMVVNSTNPAELQKEQERKTENINGLKEALLQTRQGNYEEVKLNFQQKNDPIPDKKEEEVKEEVQKVTDDGKFITDRVEYNPSAGRRFEPSKFTFLNTQQETILPAPKRNTNLDPNCSDVKAKLESLYMKSQIEKPVENEEKKDTNLTADFENFDDLKEYYESQNISFKVFKRTGKRTLHNTNKINFIVESILFGIISLCSGLLYLLFSKLGLTNPNTDFIYYLFPILYFIYLGVRFILYKKTVSKVPKPLFNFIVVFGSAILLSVIVFCLNLAFGMSINNIPACSTTMFVPMVIIFIIFIVRHYILLFAYKKFWR